MDRCLLRAAILGIFAIVTLFSVQAQDLSLGADDLRMEMDPNGGYHLFIRYKPDISSVLLTETTRDPSLKEPNYAYRTAEKNPVNGDEIRLINGYPIPKESSIYSLVTSTPEEDSELGWAYHLYIPNILYYGYAGTRNGEVAVGDGTYLNIRTFYYAYADYRGPFMDNPFQLEVLQAPVPEEEKASYMKETTDAFYDIAGENTIYAKGPSDLSELIKNIIDKEKSDDLDIVICLDATSSMKPFIDAVRQQLIDLLRPIIAETPSFRIGMVLFRDYNEEFLTKIIPFTSKFDVFQRNLNAVRVTGGGDIPEAVYEGLYDGATKMPWKADSRIMILIGDAPPHPRPRGRITRQMTHDEIEKKGIKMYAIILPN